VNDRYAGIKSIIQRGSQAVEGTGLQVRRALLHMGSNPILVSNRSPALLAQMDRAAAF
jgi:hypothetical protein